MSKFKAALVGAGNISEWHAAALRRRGVAIVGLYDVDAPRAAAAAAKLGVKAYPSIAALRDAGADVIHVLTPPHAHAAVALEAIALGCHVLVEKPLAVDAGDCRHIAAKAAETGRRVCVNHSLLFDPHVRRALETVRSGKLGTVVSVDILRSSVYPPFAGGAMPPQYRTAGYPFRDLGVHALYLFEAFLGPIRDVQASWASLGGDANLAFDEWRAQVKCDAGLGQFQLSWNVKPVQSQIIVQGTKGVLRADLFLMFQSMRSALPLPKAAERVINALTDSLQPLADVPRGIYGFLRKKVLPYHGLQDLVGAFYDALEDGGPMPVSVEDAARVVEWTERVASAADADYERRVSPLVLSDRVDVLVTGASGGLGSAVVERLQGEGRRVRVLVRRAPSKMEEGTEAALGDLGDPAAVDRAVRGARLVIHAGAAMKGGWVEHQCGTVAGTQNVIDACLRHGVERLVHVSSLSVVDWAGGAKDSPITETSALEPRPMERGHYTRAKLEAERLVCASCRDKQLPAVIIRPGQIFGGKLPLMTGAVARRLGRRWLVLGAGDVRLPLVHIDDVVDALVQAADGPLHGGEIIQVVDDWTPTQNELLRLVLGPRAPIVRLPRPAVFFLGGVSEVLLGLLGRPSPLARYRLKSALSRRTFGSMNRGILPGMQRHTAAKEAVLRMARKARSIVSNRAPVNEADRVPTDVVALNTPALNALAANAVAAAGGRS